MFSYEHMDMPVLVDPQWLKYISFVWILDITRGFARNNGWYGERERESGNFMLPVWLGWRYIHIYLIHLHTEIN